MQIFRQNLKIKEDFILINEIITNVKKDYKDTKKETFESIKTNIKLENFNNLN